MNEKKIKLNDDKHFPEKFHSNNKDNSSTISKKANQKNNLIINKIIPQNQKSHKILPNEQNQTKIKKTGIISPIQKSTFNNIKTSKTFSKNNSNNSSKIIFPKQTNLKISLTYNGTSSTQNMIEKNKITEINSNNKEKVSDNSKSLLSIKQPKKIKINKLVKSNKDRTKENSKNNKGKKIENEENDIFNFTTEEYDEKINEKGLNKNSRKHYSLTNPSILPCIPFSNPFTNNNNNINITENNEKNIKHVRSLNIDNNYDLKKKQLLMEKNYLDNLDIINVFKDNAINDEDAEKDEEDFKLNISNLDIEINQIDEELEERNIQKNHKNSFIQFNNNLSLKLAAEKSKNNTPSYMLALCPKLFLTKNKKDLIKENYAVNEPISEEVDSDSKTPKQSKIKYSLEENNTKYTTKDKYSDRNNKKFHEFDSEDISFDAEDKRNTINEKSSEKKNNKIMNLKKNKKIIKENNRKEIIDENKNLFLDRKKEGIRKKINLNEIQIDTQNINNTNIYKDLKQFIIKTDNYISHKDISSHYNNNTINNDIFYETEKNLIKYMNNKLKKPKNIDSSEKHQKAKSLLPDINLSTLYLYETIQNNSSSKNNSHNKKKKILKINNKQKDYRNKILNQEKRIIDTSTNKEEVKTPKKRKSKINNKININRNSHYKDNENKNIYRTSFSNTNINNNQNHIKKKALVQFVKNPKNKVNPFLSNFPETNDKFSYNNELNYTLNNTDYKYKNFYDFSKKRNNISKLSNPNKNTICANNESSKNIIKDINDMTHQKKISQQFIDEFNFMLELKSDNNISKNNNKMKILNQKNKKYINVDKSKQINNSFKAINKLKNEMSGNNLKKSHFIVPCHKKSKTFFISPSYAFKKNNIISEQNKNFYKRVNNNNKENKKSINVSDFNSTVQINKKKTKNNKNKKIYNTAQKSTNNRKIFDIKMMKNSAVKSKNKFKEIKKVIGENTFAKIIHKKTNTIGNTNALSFLCQNLFNYNNLIQSSNQNIFNNNIPIKNNNYINRNNQHKKSASINNLINNLDNKKKIICAMQRIKFIPVSYYSKAIKEMTQINNNLLVILVYKDENQRFVFRALYEVNVNEPQYAKKIFGPNCELNVLNINNVNNFYNYSLSSGELFRYKIIDEKNKKFNDDIVIIF